MDPSAEDAGGPPTAVAGDPAAHQVSVPQQRGPATVAPTPATTAAPASAATPTSAATAARPSAATASAAAAASSAAPATPVPAARRRTDGVAVAALISGLVPAIPVTLVLGPLALIRIGRSGARGRTLAVTGMVLAGLWIVAAAIVAAAIITRPAPRPVTLPHVFSLRAGQCLDSGASGVSGVHVVSCGRPHDAEVFATFRVAGHRYPGAAALQQSAREGCGSRLDRVPESRPARNLAGAVLRLPGCRGLVSRGAHRGLHRPRHLRSPGRLGAGRAVRPPVRMR